MKRILNIANSAKKMEKWLEGKDSLSFLEREEINSAFKEEFAPRISCGMWGGAEERQIEEHLNPVLDRIREKLKKLPVAEPTREDLLVLARKLDRNMDSADSAKAEGIRRNGRLRPTVEELRNMIIPSSFDRDAPRWEEWRAVIDKIKRESSINAENIAALIEILEGVENPRHLIVRDVTYKLGRKDGKTVLDAHKELRREYWYDIRPETPRDLLLSPAWDGIRYTIIGADPDFGKVNLAGEKLKNRDLARIDFSGADFSGADLSFTNFSYSNLAGASFRGATLNYAKFVRCNLHCTDFSGANLYNADFSGAKE